MSNREIVRHNAVTFPIEFKLISFEVQVEPDGLYLFSLEIEQEGKVRKFKQKAGFDLGTPGEEIVSSGIHIMVRKLRAEAYGKYIRTTDKAEFYPEDYGKIRVIRE